MSLSPLYIAWIAFITSLTTVIAIEILKFSYDYWNKKQVLKRGK